MKTIRCHEAGKWMVFVVCLLASAGADAQPASSKGRHKHNYKEDWDWDNRIAVKLTPTSLADPYGALLPIGLEYYSGYKYGISLDFGFPLFYSLNNNRSAFNKTIDSDFKIRADVRQYFRYRKDSRMFLGAESFYRNQAMSLRNSYFHFIDNTCYQFSQAKADKDVFGFGLIWGLSRKLTPSLLLEGHIGFGVRIVNMTPDWDVNTATPYFKGAFISLELPNEDRVGDHDVNIYIPFAIKLVYRF